MANNYIWLLPMEESVSGRQLQCPSLYHFHSKCFQLVSFAATKDDDEDEGALTQANPLPISLARSEGVIVPFIPWQAICLCLNYPQTIASSLSFSPHSNFVVPFISQLPLMATFNWLSPGHNSSNRRAQTVMTAEVFWSVGAFNNFNNYVYRIAAVLIKASPRIPGWSLQALALTVCSVCRQFD